MNYATLASPITKENAAEYARRATVARERNRAARRQEILASPDIYARKEVEREINRILQWMKKAKSRKEHAALARTLDSLWSKAFPEVKAAKPSTRRPPLPVAIHNWEPLNPPLQEKHALLVPEPSTTAPVIPVPAPAAPESPPSPAPEASPQPEPQPPMPGPVSPPKSVRVPPVVFELRNGLSLLFKRTAGRWTDEEIRLMVAVAQRKNAATELHFIRNFHNRLTPEKKSSFPATALALLKNWDIVLADARQHLPR